MTDIRHIASIISLALIPVFFCFSDEDRIFRGAGNVSAAITVDTDRFWVADDEVNVLTLHALSSPGEPLATQSIQGLFALPDGGADECDIEGAARIDNRIYWIGSHSRNRNGKLRSNRQVFFATTLQTNGNDVILTPVGTLHAGLVAALLMDPLLAGVGLREAAGDPAHDSPKLAPKKNGLNIEGLVAIPGTRSLLIGFRNPCPEGLALLVPFMNPDEVIDFNEAPSFDRPILINLGGLAIRDMTYSEHYHAFLVAAGPVDGSDLPRKVFLWSGKSDDPPVELLDLGNKGDLNPEALLALSADQLYLLSDDGIQTRDTANAATFRIRSVTLPHL